MLPFTIHCPSCQQTYDVNDEHAGQQTQCQNCQSYFAVPSRMQAQHTSLIQTTPVPNNIPAVATVPAWYKSLTIMGPLCACLLLLGGGVTYWIINNKKVEKTIVTNEVVVIHDEVLPAPAPAPIPKKAPAPAPEATPQVETFDPVLPEIIQLPKEVTIHFEMIRVEPDFLKRIPAAMFASSEDLYQTLTNETKARRAIVMFDESKLSSCDKRIVIGKQTSHRYFTEFNASEGATLIGDAKENRNTGLVIKYEYTPNTAETGSLNIDQTWTYLEDKNKIVAGGPDASMPQFKSMNNQVSCTLQLNKPVLAFSKMSKHNPSKPKSQKQWIYYLFVTLKK